MRKICVNILKVLVSVALMYFVFRKIPFHDIAKTWSGVNVGYVIAGAVFFLVSQVLSAKRLEFYLKANNFVLDFKNNVKLYFLGMFYNFFIPGGIGGDAYKIYILNQKFSWNAKQLTSSIFNDRLNGLLAIGVLMLIFIMFLIPVQWIPGAIIFILAGVLLVFLIIKKLFPVYQPIFLKTLFISVLIQGLQSICFLFLLESLDVSGNFTIYLIIFLGSSVLSLLSFAGIGVREFLFLQASKYFDFHVSVSVSASLMFTAVTAFFSILGLLFMFGKNHVKECGI